MHANGRGHLVNNISEANTVFSEYDGTCPRDIDKIISEYLV